MCTLLLVFGLLISRQCHGTILSDFFNTLQNATDNTVDNVTELLPSVTENFQNLTLSEALSVFAPALPPGTGLDAVGLIQFNGYPIEIHNATTEDGYILGLHRIPYGIKENGTSQTGNKTVVFLMTGLFSNTGVFIANGPEKSLGYILADLGYDVWIGNARGNTYSRHHVTLNPDTQPAQFFNFSLTEVGIYDVPTNIDYILNFTNTESLLYIGHSQGSTDALIAFAERPEYNEKVRLVVHLAPTGFCDHTPNPVLQVLARAQKQLQELAYSFGIYELLPRSELITLFAVIFCNTLSPFQEFCADILYFAGGFDPVEFNNTLLPIIGSLLPGGASVKEIAHYGQFVDSARFCYFDYGTEGNLIEYGSETPPDFKVENITAPTAFYYGLNDGLSAPVDVQRMASLLPNLVVNQAVDFDLFTHLDFIWSDDQNGLINDLVIALLAEY